MSLLDSNNSELQDIINEGDLFPHQGLSSIDKKNSDDDIWGSSPSSQQRREAEVDSLGIGNLWEGPVEEEEKTVSYERSFHKSDLDDTSEDIEERLNTLKREIIHIYENYDGDFTDALLGVFVDEDENTQRYGKLLNDKMDEYKSILMYSRLKVLKSYLPKQTYEEGIFHFYNSSHGALSNWKLEQEPPPIIKSHFSDPSKRDSTIEIYLYKKARLFESIHAGSFTFGRVDEFNINHFHPYIKFVINYDTQKEDVITKTFVYHQTENEYKEVDSIPDITFTYADKDEFDMGLLNAVVADGTFGEIIDIKVTDFSENHTNTRIIFPKIVNNWNYTQDQKETIKKAKILLNWNDYDENSLLNNAYNVIPEELSPPGNKLVKMYIYNSSCLYSDKFYEIIHEFPQWFDCVKDEVASAFYLRLNSLRRRGIPKAESNVKQQKLYVNALKENVDFKVQYLEERKQQVSFPRTDLEALQDYIELQKNKLNKAIEYLTELEEKEVNVNNLLISLEEQEKLINSNKRLIEDEGPLEAQRKRRRLNRAPTIPPQRGSGMKRLTASRRRTSRRSTRRASRRSTRRASRRSTRRSSASRRGRRTSRRSTGRRTSRRSTGGRTSRRSTR
jgi:hypothetical protein